jgi:hypothetical protein
MKKIVIIFTLIITNTLLKAESNPEIRALMNRAIEDIKKDSKRFADLLGLLESQIVEYKEIEHIRKSSYKKLNEMQSSGDFRGLSDAAQTAFENRHLEINQVMFKEAEKV